MGTRLWKLKRSLNNFAYRMSFVRIAPASAKPLLPVAEFLLVGFIIFTVAGGLFILVGANGGASGLTSVPQGLIFIAPGTADNQTPQEAVYLTLVYSLGFVGLYLMFMSTRFIYNQRRAYGFLAFGMLLTVVFMTTAYFVLSQKIGRL